MPKDVDKVRLTYLDTRNPGRVVLTIEDSPTRLDMPVTDAAVLAARLLEAVRASGYDLVARKKGA